MGVSSHRERCRFGVGVAPTAGVSPPAQPGVASAGACIWQYSEMEVGGRKDGGTVAWAVGSVHILDSYEVGCALRHWLAKACKGTKKLNHTTLPGLDAPNF